MPHQGANNPSNPSKELHPHPLWAVVAAQCHLSLAVLFPRVYRSPFLVLVLALKMAGIGGVLRLLLLLLLLHVQPLVFQTLMEILAHLIKRKRRGRGKGLGTEPRTPELVTDALAGGLIYSESAPRQVIQIQCLSGCYRSLQSVI
mmetsp:Transcript_19942/g.40392  ORF Transcript_19942/g.40392 Transcript_19942/m.40392 type:complete len:145 (+) Transcript_19942:1115-1549(+)